MGYRCQNPKCNKSYFGSLLKVVTQVRDVEYKKYFIKQNRQNDKKEYIFLDSAKGTEIVKENKYCDECYGLFKDINPSVVETKSVRQVLNGPPPRKDKIKEISADKSQDKSKGGAVKFKSFREAFA